MLFLYILIVFLASVGSPVQTAINNKMTQYVHSPLLAAFVSFFVSTILIACIIASGGRSLSPFTEFMGSIPLWQWLGGVMGLTGVTLLVIIFPKLGGVQTVLIPMLGMLLTSSAVEMFGWLGYAHKIIEVDDFIGFICIVAALWLYATDTGKPVQHAWLYRFLGLIVGVAFALQPVMNSQLAVWYQSSMFASWISFLVSDILFILLIVVLPVCRHNFKYIFVSQPTDSKEQPLHKADDSPCTATEENASKRPWWVWTAGICGAVYVISLTFFTARIGVELVAIVGVIGQLAGGTVIDKYGLFHSAKKQIAARQYLALVLALAGTMMMNLFSMPMNGIVRFLSNFNWLG